MSYKNPFIKVEWEDTPENLTPERIKRVKEYFKTKYNAAEVKIVTKTVINTSNVKLKSLEANDNILDLQNQKNLIKDFMAENKIEIKWELIDRLDNRVNAEIKKTIQEETRYNRWHIRKIEFSNFLSFGDDNVFDMDNIPGITSVESNPKNFGGKTTSTVDLLLFLFFNSTTKSKVALEVFNKYRDCDEVKVKGWITIDDNDYVIERTVVRKKSKAGDYSSKTNLEFYKLDAEGNPIKNMEEEQRKYTEKTIMSTIGTEEDFLSTILTTGHNLEELVDAKPTARGATLTRFLGLEALKTKEETCKNIYNEWSKKLVSNTYNITQLTTDNENSRTFILDTKIEITKLENSLITFQDLFKTLGEKRDSLMQSKNNDVDQELIRTNPTLLKRELAEMIVKINGLKDSGKLIKVVEPSSYYAENDHNELKNEINEIVTKNRILDNDITRNETLLTQLEKGSICPTCKRPLDQIDHSAQINETKEVIISLKDTRDQNLIKINESKVKEQVFITLKTEYDEYERNKLKKTKNELEIEKAQIEIDKNQARLDNYEKNKHKLEENQKIDGEIVILKTKIDTANADIRITTINIEKHKNNIISSDEKIKLNLEIINKIKSEEELIAVFKTYLLIFGKNGISKIIMRNMIPLLNQEIHRLLQDSCLFTLELNINDKNELEFLMIDNETRVVKPLGSGSGYEKTIASLAIRSVLTKVSSLPKPNVVVMDEIFKGIADENLELIGEFFKKIKNYFEHILVISHNPLIRNWSDNLMMVKKDDNVSSIEFISTKIS